MSWFDLDRRKRRKHPATSRVPLGYVSLADSAKSRPSFRSCIGTDESGSNCDVWLPRRSARNAKPECAKNHALYRRIDKLGDLGFDQSVSRLLDPQKEIIKGVFARSSAEG
jgi:hypothetical protein